MKIKTSSGTIKVNKKTPYGKFVIVFVNDCNMFSGRETLAAAWIMCQQIMYKYRSISCVDAARLTAVMFAHKPTDELLDMLTGIKMKRY